MFVESSNLTFLLGFHLFPSAISVFTSYSFEYVDSLISGYRKFRRARIAHRGEHQVLLNIFRY